MLGAVPELGDDGKTAILFYMSTYLELLQRANLHTFYDIPDFEGTNQAKMDHASHCRPVDAEILNSGLVLHGADPHDVNAYLQRRWLSAASAIEPPSNPLSICLAELDSSWLPHPPPDAPRIRARFASPTVTALCSSEAILRVYVEDIVFVEEGEVTK